MSVFLTCLLAVVLDRWLGEPRYWHPLVAFGQWANSVEEMCYGGDEVSAESRRLRGVIALLLCVLPFVLIAGFLSSLGGLGLVFDVLLLYLALGWSSMKEHARNVMTPLQSGNLELARTEVGKIVSRDTADMDEQAVTRATIESVLENGNDAVFGALFWFVVAGGPGVVVYRLVNTLDAMWGYKTFKYYNFGWAVARFDDMLNWIPARLTALTYTLLGQREKAWRCWQEQGMAWKSPNAGPVMASGAGALGVTLGGDASYHGQVSKRPYLGRGPAPVARDIYRALQLLKQGVIAWLVAIFIISLF